jgi:hypothetical protein
MEFEKALGFVFEWLFCGLDLGIRSDFCRIFSLILKRGIGKIDLLTTIKSTK